MLINDLYQIHQCSTEIQILRTKCMQFFKESQNQPLLKNLSIQYSDFDKIKVRKRKGETGDFTETFNEAFEQQHPGLRQRAIFANGVTSFQPIIENTLESFYIFPINGYKFMYSREVENSGQEYKQVFDTLFEQFGEEKGNEVITDLLRFTYTSQNLYEGINSGSEIIIYGIPYFYAIRTTSIENYQQVLSAISS
jgi:hypothetical protein